MSKEAVFQCLLVSVGIASLLAFRVTLEAADSEGGGTMSATKVVVNAGQHERMVCPVRVDVGRAIADLGGVLLVDEQDGASIAAQIAEENGKYILSFVVPRLSAGQSASYSIRKGTAELPSVAVAKKEEGTIDVTVGGVPLTAYHYSAQYKKPFLYPVIGTDGAYLTRRWPIEDIAGEPHDHVHQKSCWVAHGAVNGIDFWAEGKGSGTQRTDEIVVAQSGDVYGLIHARNSWVDESGKKVISEERRYMFYNTPPELRIFDLEVTLTATEGDAKFGDTKEGGIVAFRVNPVINGERGGEIRNSSGAVGEDEAWGKRASWCDYSGAINNKKRGIAVFDNPMNPRYPACWHVRGYGLMAANYFGYSNFKSTYEKRGDFVLPAGESMTFRYRIILHDGNAVEGNVADRYTDYIVQPAVKVSP